MKNIKFDKNRDIYPAIHVCDSVNSRPWVGKGNKAITFSSNLPIIYYLQLN